MMRNDSQLVQEALVRYIRDAKRWTAVIEGWEALLNVQRITKTIKAESESVKVSALEPSKRG